MSKFCPKCKKTLLLKSFGKNKNKKDGLQNYCKECRKTQHNENRDKILSYQQKYRAENIDTLREKEKRYSQDNKEYRKLQHKAYYEKNKDSLLCKNRNRYEQNKEDYKAINKKWAENNKDKKRVADKQYRQNNIERINLNQKRWKGKNSNHLKSYYRRRARDKRKSDIVYNLNHRMSTAVRFSLVNEKNNRSWQEIVGYSVDQLKKRLYATMPVGFEWENFLRGDLHIDHIIPKSWFNFDSTEDDEFKQCWGLDNLQLLPAFENLSKSNRSAYSVIPERRE